MLLSHTLRKVVLSPLALPRRNFPSSLKNLVEPSFPNPPFTGLSLGSHDITPSLDTSMEQSMVEGLINLRLTKEEEEEIPITTKCKADLLEECSLSLFGRLLTDRHQN